MKTINKFYKHIIIFIIFLVIVNYSVGYFFAHQKNKYLSVQTELLTTKYETQYKYFKIMSHDIYTMYSDNQELIQLFAQAEDANSSQKALIRDEMHNMLKKRYKRLENMGVKQLHFHLRDNTSFLRMHKPEKFGDDLTAFRESVVVTNREQKTSEGFEVGKAQHGFRYVYPVFDKNSKHIGSVEISFSSTQLLSYITDKFVLERHFLVLKSEVNKNLWSESIDEFYEDSVENIDYFVEKSTKNYQHDKKVDKVLNNIDITEKIAKGISRGEPFSVSGEYNYNSLVVTLLPIKNPQKDIDTAYIVMFIESDFLDSLILEEYYTKTLFIAMSILLFIFSIYVSIVQFKLKEMAHYDKLTSLPNRAYFYIELAQEIKRARRHKDKLSVMFIDLDGFKNINDTYGHNVGDELLIRVSRKLENAIREMDIVGRIGGDEFIVLLTGIKNEADSPLVAQKIIDSLNQEMLINNNSMNIGASIGIANFPQDGNDLETIINNADNAMYAAKARGKNNFVQHKENI